MSSLTHQESIVLFLSLAVLLFTARLLGEIARRFNQPAVLGEILAGILLGPTLLGAINPSFQTFLFPNTGILPIVLKSFLSIAVVLFLFVAGLEVDLSTVWRQGRSAFVVSLGGLIVPFVFGVLATSLIIDLGMTQVVGDPFIYSLFLGTAFAISALPVIAKIMMDLNLYRSDLGMVVISAAIINDLIGWLIFAVLLGMIGAHSINMTHTIMMTGLFVVGVLFVGRWVLDRILPWIQAQTTGQGAIIGFMLSGALVCAAFTELIGIHALFGAFLFGVAIGDSRHLKERTRVSVEQFVSYFFAPLFFASIGLRINFIDNFHLGLTVLMIVLASLGKLLGCGMAARLSGFSASQSWAIGFGMNARGAMEIILGLLALQAGLIGERLFVSLVIMALVTSMTSGSLMQMIMKRKKEKRFYEYLSPKLFIRPLVALNRHEAINELSQMIARETGLNAKSIADAVWEREKLIPTGLDHGVAVPHGRLNNSNAPVIMAVGISKHGIDFD
jgi:Kef-type K+ transport system membrane component KefB